MSDSFPQLQRRHAAFLATVEECTLRDLLDHLHVVNHELQDPDADESSDPRWLAADDYLATVPDGADLLVHLAEEIEALEALIAEHGDRTLK